MRFVAYFILTFMLLTIAPSPQAAPVGTPKPDWKYVETRLKKAGFKNAYIKALIAAYDPEPFTEVLELNTLLFLRKTDYHGVQVTPEAANTVKGFVNKNRKALASAEKDYGVTKEVVASLLWMESRHGKNPGKFHVPSVFLDLVQADRPDVVAYLYQAGTRFTKKVTKQDKRDIASRAKKRVKWAIAELKAIQKMHDENIEVLRHLHGSFAGAFGMAQFEPSSYVAYAKSYKPNEFPDLERADDAIQSVAYYLHKNGWKKNKPKSYVQALMRYNNSHDYAAAILKLAEDATPNGEKSKRAPAGKTKHHR